MTAFLQAALIMLLLVMLIGGIAGIVAGVLITNYHNTFHAHEEEDDAEVPAP